MKSISKILMVLIVALSTQITYAQIKNTQTVNVNVYGNCEMCKSAIEKSGNLKNIAQITWNKDTKMAMLTYDGQKTTTDEILKRIALAGYDSESFLAPDDVYSKLPECCQYTRQLKPAENSLEAHADIPPKEHNPAAASITQKTELQTLLDTYFTLKDALVNTDATTAAQKATALASSAKNMDVNKLSTVEKTAWMKVMNDLSAGATTLSASRDIAKQRAAFATISKSIYEIARVANYGSPLYYQHCPMYNEGKNSNWLSKQEEIKNPFYGSQMLTCGSVQETISGK